MSTEIDLYLGGTIGRWVLDALQGLPEVRHVICSDVDTLQKADCMGYQTSDGIPSPADIHGGIGVSVHFPIILPAAVIQRYGRIYNLHPGLLPWGRGYFPVFWALWERTPAGATFHEMTTGLDKGPIVAQTEVEYTEADTGQSLHERVTEAEKTLFLTYWPRLCSEDLPGARPQMGAGSYRPLKDFLALRDNPPLDQMTAQDLVRLARCLTFPGRPGPRVGTAGKTYQVTLQSDTG